MWPYATIFNIMISHHDGHQDDGCEQIKSQCIYIKMSFLYYKCGHVFSWNNRYIKTQFLGYISWHLIRFLVMPRHTEICMHRCIICSTLNIILFTEKTWLSFSSEYMSCRSGCRAPKVNKKLKFHIFTFTSFSCGNDMHIIHVISMSNVRTIIKAPERSDDQMSRNLYWKERLSLFTFRSRHLYFRLFT